MSIIELVMDHKFVHSNIKNFSKFIVEVIVIKKYFNLRRNI